MIDLSPSQLSAATLIRDWFMEQEEALLRKEKMPRPIFRLFGYAGVGKTTTIRSIMDLMGLSSKTNFAAYTGKAAMVMRKTGLPAQTIHSLIYQPLAPDENECRKLSLAIKKEENSEKKKEMKRELKEKSKVRFVLRPKSYSSLSSSRLLVLDECSMVNDEMLKDLLSFGVPMLVLGDPGQLPPIEGEGALTKAKPDVLLTEIHRQARGNPIIDFATRARNGIFIPKMSLGSSRHIDMKEVKNSEIMNFDQIICGKNISRMNINRKIRELKNLSSDPYPTIGEKLICLKNDMENDLFNGSICEVVKVGELLDTSLQLWIRKETDEASSPPLLVKALRAPFDYYHDKEAMENLRWWDREGTNEFDFGYCLTVHKAQGSQWNNVLFWDDKLFAGWKKTERKQLVYTAITRAIDTITIAS